MKKSILIILIISVLSFSGCGLFDHIYNISEITEVEQYGNFYPLDQNDQYITEYIGDFVPKKLEDYFSNVKYVYRYCTEPLLQEIYLEFTIEDETKYNSYINEYIDVNHVELFEYDDSFFQYQESDIMALQHQDDVDGPTVGYTLIKKILYSNETNTIIFIVISIPYNDMPFSKENIYFFEKYDIDLLHYKCDE